MSETRPHNSSHLRSAALFTRLLALSATIALAAPADASTRIGVSLPLSGSASVLASQFLEGARLAVDMLAPGGEVELVVADDGCDEDIGELAAADLRNAGVSIVTGLLCAGPAFAAARAFHSSAIPVVVAGARSERLIKDAERNEWNVWRIAPSDADAARAASAVLSRRWTARPWALVDDGTVFGRTFADEFRALMEAGGLPPQFTDAYRPAQVNQIGLLRRLQRAGVSAAFIAGAPEDFAVIAGGMKEAGVEIELAGGPSLDLLPWIEQASLVPDGALAAVAADPSSLPSAKDLTLVLEKRGIDPEPHVYLGYAALQLVLAARRDEPGATARALGDTVFHTVIGNVDFDETGRNLVNPYSLYVWQDGSFRPAEGGQ